MTRVLFYVQPLLGLGHDARAAAMTRQMVAAGLEVTYVTGGVPSRPLDLGGARYAALPPLRAADARYQELADAAGHPPDDALWQARAGRLDAIFDEARPEILIVETFPFGRWPFRREILPLLDAASGRCRIVCSIRDIQEPKAGDKRNRQIVELVDRYFDLILVHGDPELVTLDQSFPHTAAIGSKIAYTGYVVSDPPPAADGNAAGRDEVVVSAGGGATCTALMTAALEAARQDCRRWRFLIGPNCPADIRERLFSAAGIAAEAVRPDFRGILGRAALSISQSGYNTTMDVLASGVRSVMVPFAGFGQQEQSLRAHLLAARGRIELLPERCLTPATLLAAAARALARPPCRPSSVWLDGARETAELLAGRRVAGNRAPPRI